MEKKCQIPEKHPKENEEFFKEINLKTNKFQSERKNGKKINLYTEQLFPKDDNYLNLLIYSHGLHEHCSRYLEYCTFLSKSKFKFACFLIDHEGHGIYL
jgi:alpha-beta hydrolase superfamily lysophospholipase